MRLAWIAVAEALPDDELLVMIALSASDVPVWIGYYEEGEWYAANGDPLASVTHWADIPEGPQR